MAAPHSIYADEMLSLMNGSPLWEPNLRPDPELSLANLEVSIGDVGYIRYGRFNRLFNATLPPGHPQNEFGVPEGYEQLHLDERAMIHRRLSPGAMLSRSITKLGADIEFSGSVLQAGVGFEFSCKKDRGAVLIINSEARRKDTEQRGALKKYALKHHKFWYLFANNPPQLRDISLNDLIFVTGRDNTADWAVAAFAERAASGGVSFEAGYPAIAGGKFSIWGSWKAFQSIHFNCGPQMLVQGAGPSAEDTVRPVCAAELEAYDQCIFLRGFRVMDRKSHVLKIVKMKVPSSSGGLDLIQTPWVQRSTSSSSSLNRREQSGATSYSSSWGKRSTASTSDASSFVAVSDEPEGISPSEYLLAYILQNSDADIAIIHDDDICQIVMKNTDDINFNHLVLDIVPRVVVDVDGVGTILRQDAELAPTIIPLSKGIVAAQQRRSTMVPSIKLPTTEEQTRNKAIEFEDPTDMSLTPSKKSLSLPGVDDVHQCKRSSQSQQGHISNHPNRDGRFAGLDRTVFDQEQETLRAEDSELQLRLSAVRDKISLMSTTGSGAIRDRALHTELDSLRNQMLMNKASRGRVEVQLQRIEEQNQWNSLDLRRKGKKLPAKTIVGLTTQIEELVRRLDGDSKSSETDIRRRIRKLNEAKPAIEAYETLQAVLAQGRAQAEELRNRLGSLSEDVSGKIDNVNAQIDALRKQRDELSAKRTELFAELDSLKKQSADLSQRRRQSKERFLREEEAYFESINEQSAKRAEQTRIERVNQEEKKRTEARERLLEKAGVPVFAVQKGDCRGLLQFFSRLENRPSGSTSSLPGSEPQTPKGPSSSGHNHPGVGWIPMRSKSEGNADFFTGSTKEKKRSQREIASPLTSKKTKVNIPWDIMSTLITYEIRPPATAADIPQTIAEIERKIKWFDDNERDATEANIAQTAAFLERIGPLPTATL